MTTRRALLQTGVTIAAGSLVLRATQSAFASNMTQEAQRPPRTTDEMTADTAQSQQHFAPPDFGPPPATLPAETKAVSGAGSLKEHARRNGLVAGAAVVVRVLQSDPALAQLAAEQYGMLVPENELKWVALRPAKDRFDFSNADALFAFARQHQMQVRGHTLVWHNSVPAWLSAGDSNLDVRGLLVEHIRTVVGRYRGRVHSWDVVNEALLPKDAQENGLRRSFWFDRVGPDYIELAFRTAREADPQAKLAYNDYGVEYDNAEDAERRRLVLALLRRLKERSVPLNAVGIQAHIKAGSPSTIGRGLADYIEQIRQMGLDVYLTEMDVNEDDFAFDDAERRDRAVAETYRNLLDVALSSPAVKLVLTWGISDRRTWLNDGPTHHRKQPNRPQRSLPFDPEYRPTAAFFAMRDCFDRRDSKGVARNSHAEGTA